MYDLKCGRKFKCIFVLILIPAGYYICIHVNLKYKVRFMFVLIYKRFLYLHPNFTARVTHCTQDVPARLVCVHCVALRAQQAHPPLCCSVCRCSSRPAGRRTARQTSLPLLIILVEIQLLSLSITVLCTTMQALRFGVFLVYLLHTVGGSQEANGCLQYDRLISYFEKAA